MVFEAIIYKEHGTQTSKRYLFQSKCLLLRLSWLAYSFGNFTLKDGEIALLKIYDQVSSAWIKDI